MLAGRMGSIALSVVVALAVSASAQLPARLTDAEFWSLVQSLSEPHRDFAPENLRVSDNLVSNEVGLQKVIPELTSRVAPNGVYLGVGPEQNFTYIAAVRPAIAFIVDIRRGNRDVHLLYKALFELASDRVEFLALLFSLPRPAGLGDGASVDELFAAFSAVAASETMRVANLAAIHTHLITTRGFPLSDVERLAIETIHRAFARFGPGLHYWSGTDVRPHTGLPSYAALMLETDGSGRHSSFLASERRFNTVRSLHLDNLIVPVVGDFAGPTALGAIGRWLNARGAAVGLFYQSNVDVFLKRGGTWPGFCRNVGLLPLTSSSLYVRLDGRMQDAGGRRLVAHGGEADGSIRLRWSDGTSESVTASEFAAVYWRLSGSQTGSLVDLSQPCG